MEIPYEIRSLTETAVSQYPLHQLKEISRSITQKYKQHSGKGERLVVDRIEATVYAAVRMPATYASVYSALYHTLECIPMTETYSLMDVGAGTGAGTFAAAELLKLCGITCFEREREMRILGRSFTEGMKDSVLKQSRWIDCDLQQGIDQRADIVLSSYVLNEMTEQQRQNTVQNLWEHTDRLLLIVEPGTPEAFLQLRRIRDMLLLRGAHIAAPCVMDGQCTLGENDWCHFTARVQRSKLHKLLKDADVPYEDEKFSYIAFVRKTVERNGCRLLRHPIIAKGNIRLELCTENGKESRIITAKNKKLFKAARKADSGDLFDRI